VPAATYDRKYYETQYRNYERQNPARKLDYYVSVAEEACRGIARPRVLDIGCAFGLFLDRLGPRWDRTGIDASEYAIATAGRSVPNVRFQVSPPDSMPVQGPFDLITAFDVLEHIPRLDGIFGWIAANLASHGQLLFVVPVYDGPTGPLVRLLDRDPTHVHKEGRRFWLDSAARHMEVLDYSGIFRYLFARRFYAHVVTKGLRCCSPAIACRARRRA
jgi:SAM-dependent methyltransferase